MESLGAKFVFVESEENLETEGGYAKEATEEYKKKQEELMKQTVKNQDVVITTALIPGKKAPLIITEEMVLSMKTVDHNTKDLRDLKPEKKLLLILRKKNYWSKLKNII